MPNALPIRAFKVRSLTVGRMELTWEVEDTDVDVWDYTFQILRSESPEGPYEPITGTFEDRYIFVDSRVPTGAKFRQLWYKLRSTHKASSTVRDHGPVAHEAEADLVAEYIRKHEQVVFTQFTGRQCWLLKRRSFGTRCHTCWDSTLGKRIRANCPDCFDTGFLRGYWNPILVWVQIDPPGQAKQNHGQQIGEEVLTSARLTFYPNVTRGDVIIEAENKRWRVTRLTRSERLRAPVKQELVLRQIQETDVEYSIPLNIEGALKDIQPSAPRTFENPADLQSAIDQRVPNVFANYLTVPGHVPEE